MLINSINIFFFKPNIQTFSKISYCNEFEPPYTLFKYLKASTKYTYTCSKVLDWLNQGKHPHKMASSSSYKSQLLRQSPRKSLWCISADRALARIKNIMYWGGKKHFSICWQSINRKNNRINECKYTNAL